MKTLMIFAVLILFIHLGILENSNNQDTGITNNNVLGDDQKKIVKRSAKSKVARKKRQKKKSKEVLKKKKQGKIKRNWKKDSKKRKFQRKALRKKNKKKKSNSRKNASKKKNKRQKKTTKERKKRKLRRKQVRNTTDCKYENIQKKAQTWWKSNNNAKKIYSNIISKETNIKSDKTIEMFKMAADLLMKVTENGRTCKGGDPDADVNTAMNILLNCSSSSLDTCGNIPSFDSDAADKCMTDLDLVKDQCIKKEAGCCNFPSAEVSSCNASLAAADLRKIQRKCLNKTMAGSFRHCMSLVKEASVMAMKCMKDLTADCLTTTSSSSSSGSYFFSLQFFIFHFPSSFLPNTHVHNLHLKFNIH